MTSYCQLTKLYATPYDKIIYFYVVIWQNAVMKSLIIHELKEFFAKNPEILPYHLAISAEVDPSIVHNAIKDKREDMFSSTADKLRSAMRRLERELTHTVSAETPNERKEASRNE